MNVGIKWTKVCQVRSTLHMGERLISPTVKSSECLECHLRVRAVPEAQPLGTFGNVIGRQRETGLSLVPTVGTFGLTYRRGASLSTHLSKPFANASYPISSTFVAEAWLAQVQGGVLQSPSRAIVVYCFEASFGLLAVFAYFAYSIRGSTARSPLAVPRLVNLQ